MNSHNKLIIFDLDGVLIESKDAHHNALNKALKASNFVGISDLERPKYEAMPTRAKLDKLGIIDPATALNIRVNKAKFFEEDFVDNVDVDWVLIEALDDLKAEGYKLAVASNAVRPTVWNILNNLGIIGYFDYIVSNEDVKNPKPSPDMYWKCMSELNAIPDTTLILEDSPLGLEGAYNSCAMVDDIDDPQHLIEYIKDLGYLKMKFNVYNSSDLYEVIYKPEPEYKRNIVIPMAGAGSRFKAAGFDLPKPLIDVAGKPMVQWVLDNLNDVEGRRIFIVQQAHIDEFHIDKELEKLSPDCVILSVHDLTSGAVLSVLEAYELINNDTPLLIVNSDQFIDVESGLLSDFVKDFDEHDGGIICFDSDDSDPRWSYVKTDIFGVLSQVAEKQAISNRATTGIYSFTKGSDFVSSAYDMIGKGITHNKEYYIAPVFNEGIQAGKRYITRTLTRDSFHGLGDPQSLVNFLNKQIKGNN